MAKTYENCCNLNLRVSLPHRFRTSSRPRVFSPPFSLDDLIISLQDSESHQVIVRWCVDYHVPYTAPLTCHIPMPMKLYSSVWHFRPGKSLHCFFQHRIKHGYLTSPSILPILLATTSLSTPGRSLHLTCKPDCFEAPCLHIIERQDRIQVHRRWSLDDQRCRGRSRLYHCSTHACSTVA